MGDYLSELYKWREKRDDKSASKILREALRQIHEECFSNRSKAESVSSPNAQDLLAALEKESRKPNGLLSQARAGSQGTYYNLIKEGFPELANPSRKAIAILSFLEDRYGIRLIFKDDGSLDRDEDKVFNYTISPVNNDDEPDWVDTDDSESVWYTAYYWRDDQQIGIASLELYKLIAKNKVFQRANFQLFYSDRVVSLNGRIETTDLNRPDINLFIKLRDDADQIERDNAANNNISAVITNIAIFISDNSKEWPERKVLFATYTSVHRKNPRYAYSGLMMLIQNKPSEVAEIISKAIIPPYVHRYLFQQRLKAPYGTINSIDEFVLSDEMFHEHFVGNYTVYYLSARYNTLEEGICKIMPNGFVTLKTARREKALIGQCIRITDLISHIQFGYMVENGQRIPRFTYTIERSKADDIMYGVYSGVNSHLDIKSGRVFFKKEHKKDLEVNSYELDSGNKALSRLIRNERIMYTYLSGSRQEHYSDGNALRRFYNELEITNQKKDESHILTGVYRLLTTETTYSSRKVSSQDRSRIKLAIYPLFINRFGIARIKGRFNQSEDRVRENKNSIQMEFSIPEYGGTINILCNLSNDVSKPTNGIITRQFYHTLDSRYCVLSKIDAEFPETEFAKMDYDDKIEWDSEAFKSLNSEMNGLMTSLMGQSSRYISIVNDKHFYSDDESIQ